MLRFFIAGLPLVCYFIVSILYTSDYQPAKPSNNIILPTYIIDSPYPPNNDCFVNFSENLNNYGSKLYSNACMLANRQWLKVSIVSN